MAKTTGTKPPRYFWAYAIKNNRATLLAFDSRESALIERERLKMSDAETVGSLTKRKVSESSIRKAFEDIGRTVEHVRNETETPAPN